MEQVLEQIQQLPESLQQEALHYLEDFVARHTQPQKNDVVNRKDLLGIWKGQVSMAEDFDAPLDDLH
jgi:Protein of unknown function (DUF2281)